MPEASHPSFLTSSAERMVTGQAIHTASGTDLGICMVAADVLDVMCAATLAAVGVADPAEQRAVLAILWSRP